MALWIEQKPFQIGKSMGIDAVWVNAIAGLRSVQAHQGLSQSRGFDQGIGRAVCAVCHLAGIHKNQDLLCA